MNPIQSIASFGIKILTWQANRQKQDVLTRVVIDGLYRPHGAIHSPYIVSNMMLIE
jgi:hypothetical protein